MRKTLLSLLVVAAGCGAVDEDPAHEEPEPNWVLIPARCDIEVRGVGTVNIEADYLPHVIQCENDGAGFEALKAQAVSARSYAYYKIDESGSIEDGQGDQVYSCGKTPRQEHYDAVAATEGEVLMYRDVVIAAFYVAGAQPSNADTCEATSLDPDPTNTERFVTYNDGMEMDQVEQTSLGWIHPENWPNRGCMSQWGSRCLDERGDDYASIARFYYGADIVRGLGEGPCINRSALRLQSEHDAGGNAWSPAMRIGSGN